MSTILDRALSPLARIRHNIAWMLTILAGLLVGVALPDREAEAKTPGSTYCFYDTCHRVRSLAETQAMVGRTEALMTSFYDDCKSDSYNPCGLTSSGEVFRPHAPDNAASPLYPDGTTLLVFNPSTQRAAVVRVNNAGPYWGNRKLDVSRATADKLGFKSRGVAKLQVRVLTAPSKAEATYRKHRRYKDVPGYVGRFASLDSAAGGLVAVAALQAVTRVALAPVTKAMKLAAAELPSMNIPSLTGVTAPRVLAADVKAKAGVDNKVAKKARNKALARL